MVKEKVVVIGGGLGGLSAAIRLAVDGYDVQVFEKNERAGGKLNLREGKGYTFDTGPSILTMPWVLENLFKSAGRDLHNYMTIERVEPQWRTFFIDGAKLDLTSDLPKLLKEIEGLSKKDATAVFEYIQYCARMYELSLKSFYNKSLSGLKDLRKLHKMSELLEMNPMKSMSDRTDSYITDPHLRQLFDFFAMYIGSSPYHAPAILSQLIYVQLGLGIYYVKGGMYNIARGMLQLLDELKVPVHTDSTVEEIIHNGSQATGIRLAGDQTIPADKVVCNLEVLPALKSLLSSHPESKVEALKLEKFEPAVSGLVLLLGVNTTYDQLAHHNFFFSKDPKKEFTQIFDEGKPADDPTIYIGVSKKSDPSQAADGKENLFVLTHVPPLKEGESWAEIAPEYRRKVLSKLEEMGLTDLQQHIEYEEQFIPDDLERLYGANGGSIYGVVTDRKKNGGFKIPSQSALLDNLYFVGGSTHPGGGVPMVTLSGQLTADLIKEKEALTVK